VDAFDLQAFFAEGGQMRPIRLAPGDERHVLPGLREQTAVIAPYSTCTHDSDFHIASCRQTTLEELFCALCVLVKKAFLR
jgi:hypothetical protein